MRPMVAHAKCYNGVLTQVTKVLSADKSECCREERHMWCCQVTISSLACQRSSHNLMVEEIAEKEKMREIAI